MKIVISRQKAYIGGGLIAYLIVSQFTEIPTLVSWLVGAYVWNKFLGD